MPNALQSTSDFKGDRLSVKMFAAVGDGTTDCTSALASAVASLQPGQRLLVPSGAYRLTDTIDLSNKQGINIIGDGWGYGNELTAVSGQLPKFVWDGADNAVMFNCGGLEASALRGFGLHSGGKTGVTGLKFQANPTYDVCFDITVDHVWFHQFAIAAQLGDPAVTPSDDDVHSIRFNRCYFSLPADGVGIVSQGRNALVNSVFRCMFGAEFPRTFAATFDAGSDTVGATGHGRADGNIVRFTTTGSLPASLSNETYYYVVNATLDTLQVSLTAGGSPVDISDAGTGTHSLVRITNGGTNKGVWAKSGSIYMRECMFAGCRHDVYVECPSKAAPGAYDYMYTNVHLRDHHSEAPDCVLEVAEGSVLTGDNRRKFTCVVDGGNIYNGHALNRTFLLTNSDFAYHLRDLLCDSGVGITLPDVPRTVHAHNVIFTTTNVAGNTGGVAVQGKYVLSDGNDTEPEYGDRLAWSHTDQRNELAGDLLLARPGAAAGEGGLVLGVNPSFQGYVEYDPDGTLLLTNTWDALAGQIKLRVRGNGTPKDLTMTGDGDISIPASLQVAGGPRWKRNGNNLSARTAADDGDAPVECSQVIVHAGSRVFSIYGYTDGRLYVADDTAGADRIRLGTDGDVSIYAAKDNASSAVTTSAVQSLINKNLDDPTNTFPEITPAAHAATHQDGGADEVATATPAAAAIPKADAGGTLNAWVDAAPVVGSASATAQTASIGATNLLATGHAAGLYRVSATLRTTTAGSAGTATLSLTWTGNGIAESLDTMIGINLTSTAQSDGGLGFQAAILHSDGAPAIQYAVTVAGAAGSPQYAVDLVIERLA